MTVPYTFANVSGPVPASELDANFAAVDQYSNTAGVVLTNAQPNITSVGTLTNLAVIGNITATTFIGNITGAIANALYADAAGQVLDNAQPNITSVGLLDNLIVAGITTANVITATNITAVTVGGNGANLSSLNGGNVIGTVPSAVTTTSAIIANTITDNTQANITSVGTLTSLSVAGNIDSGNLTTGFLQTANDTFIGGNILSSGLISVLGNINTFGNLLVGNVVTTGVINAAGNVRGTNINTNQNVSAVGNVYGNNIVATSNVVFSDSSKFSSAAWTLVETINTNLTYGPQVVATTQSYDYYSSNYNEVLYLCGAGGNGGTITIPVNAVNNNSQWNVNGSVGIKWANTANASITVIDLQDPLTIVTVTMYVR